MKCQMKLAEQSLADIPTLPYVRSRCRTVPPEFPPPAETPKLRIVRRQLQWLLRLLCASMGYGKQCRQHIRRNTTESADRRLKGEQQTVQQFIVISLLHRGSDPCRSLQIRGSLNIRGKGRILARPSGPGSDLLSSSRRVFLQIAQPICARSFRWKASSHWARPARFQTSRQRRNGIRERLRRRATISESASSTWRANPGLNAKTIFGGEHKNKYLLETTGCGVAFYDYDNDGWLDIFLVNGTRLEGFPAGSEPTSHLFNNNRDGTFTDVTLKAGVAHSGWGQGCCVGDYDNDGWDDLFVTYFGKNVLYHNNGDGTFTDVSQKAGVAGNGKRWNTGCAFVDYDRDGSSICSSPTTSTWIWPPPRFRNPARACTKA